MSANCTIEWTNATWNPVRGCDKISPGCKHCYAQTFAERWRGIPGHAYEHGFDLRKKEAGRTLGGRIYDEFPLIPTAPAPSRTRRLDILAAFPQV